MKSFLQLLYLFQQVLVHDLDMSALHAKGLGLDNTCGFKLPEGIHDDGAGYLHLIRNPGGHQQAFRAVQSGAGMIYW